MKFTYYIRTVVNRIACVHSLQEQPIRRDTVTLQDWGALGELVGGLAIIVSLVYVGLQVKQSTAAARVATSQSFSTQYTETMLQIADPGFRDIWWRGITGLDNLKGSETAAFMAVMGSIVRMWESFYLQKQEGTFEPRIFDSWMIQLLDLFAQQGVREYWAIRKHQFTSEFVEFLDERSAANKPKPMYGTESQ
jgi:hypothetical protein